MNIGMLWFDNDPKADLTTKVERAAQYYYEKYGKRPNTCYVHPSMMSPYKKNGIEILETRSVLPNHLWIGIDERLSLP